MTDSAATFHPIPSSDRSPLAPLVPDEVTFARGRITCVYEGQPDEVYVRTADFWRESQLSAAELVGDLLDLDALRTEAARAGDTLTAQDCDRAADGDVEALERCALVRLDSALA